MMMPGLERWTQDTRPMCDEQERNMNGHGVSGGEELKYAKNWNVDIN